MKNCNFKDYSEYASRCDYFTDSAHDPESDVKEMEMKDIFEDVFDDSDEDNNMSLDECLTSLIDEMKKLL